MVKESKESVSFLIKKELNIQLAKITEEDKTKGVTSVGDLTMVQVVKIAKAVKGNMLAKDFKSAVKQVVGSANSMQGILIEGKRPKEIAKEIEEGKWDQLIK